MKASATGHDAGKKSHWIAAGVVGCSAILFLVACLLWLNAFTSKVLRTFDILDPARMKDKSLVVDLSSRCVGVQCVEVSCSSMATWKDYLHNPDVSLHGTGMFMGNSSTIYPGPGSQRYIGGVLIWTGPPVLNAEGRPGIFVSFWVVKWPIWHFIVLFGVVPIVVLSLKIARISGYFWRIQHGRCAKCGYDLRATPDRCPECGYVPAKSPMKS